MYGKFLEKTFNGEVNLYTGVIKVMLLTSSATLNQDTDDYINDVSANEVSGAGYSAGGATVTGATPTYTAGTNTFALEANNVSWASSTITARYMVVYIDTGNPATSPVIAYSDFGGDQSTVDGTFTLSWDADGIFTAVV
jgi:hypothetical protein